MRNENVCTCEKCGKEILKMTQLMHFNHCPGNRQNAYQPVIEPSDVDVNLIDDHNDNDNDIQYKECTKCNSYFPENEYEDHMLCHRLEEENTTEINRQQQERQQRQHQQAQQQRRQPPQAQHQRRNNQSLLQELLSTVHQARNNEQYGHQHQQPSQHQEHPIQRFIRTSTDSNGNIIKEKEEHYSNGRIITTKVVFDPYGNRISSSSTTSYSNNNNNNDNDDILNIPDISMFRNRNNNSYGFNLSFGSSNRSNNRSLHRQYDQLRFSVEQLLQQLVAAPKTKPVSKEVIDELPQTIVNDVNKLSSEKKNCVICFTDFENGDKTVVLPCIHLFHYDCIVQWFESHNTCPVCKFEIKGINH